MVAQPYSSSVTSFCFRLGRDQDLKKEIFKYAEQQGLQAAVILSGVGSLQNAHLRLSDHKQGTSFEGPFEIVSLIGTVNRHGLHVHISIADNKGQVFGGHLLDGCLIHTTAEIVLLEHNSLEFKREMDASTGYKELVISRRG